MYSACFDAGRMGTSSTVSPRHLLVRGLPCVVAFVLTTLPVGALVAIGLQLPEVSTEAVYTTAAPVFFTVWAAVTAVLWKYAFSPEATRAGAA